ncbi:metE, partial [Symbiodinium microadriaticum]
SLSSTASAPSQEHAAASASASRLCLFSVAEDAAGDVASEDAADVAEDVDICSLSVVGSAVLSIVGGDAEVDVDADLHELGIDSLGLAELMGLLEDPAAIDDRFGQGCLSIDKIMEEPTCRAIVKNLEEVGGVLSAKETLAPKPRASMASLPTTAHPAPPTAAVDSEPKVPTQEPKQVASEDLSKCWIRTTHVGSLPRPNHSKLDMEQVVAEQEMAAVDIINDGEWVRDSYIADVIVRIQGLSGDSTKDVKTSCCAKHSMPIAADMQDVPLYAQRFTGGNGLITLNPKREATSGLACVGHPCYQPGEIPCLKPFLEAACKSGKAPGDCFFSVPSPGTLALFCRDCFFHRHGAYVAALGEALRGEYAEIARHGLLLQVDCPDLAMGRHTRWSQLTDAEFLELAKSNVEALNRALEDVPAEQIRIHVCWGNYAGPHHKDMPAELLWPLIGEIKATYILVEGANPRHRIDVAAFEDAVRKGYFKQHQVIAPGLVDSTTARVEDPKLIAESLLRYVRAVGHPSRVLASTDCGFASTAKSTAISADIAWMKLRSLAEGAALATRLFIEERAPVPCRSPSFVPTPFRPVIFAKSSDAYALQLQAAFSGLTVHPASIFAE